MATSIFKLVGSIYVENNEANKAIEDTGKKAETTGSKLSSAVGTAAKWGAGIATAAGAASVALFGTATAAADSLDQIQKGAQKLGMSYESYQKLSYACDRSGASIDNLSRGMKNITSDLAKASDGNMDAVASYEALGISVQNADGSMRSADEIMQESLLALADLTDETERNTMAQEIFGNGYTELLPLLNSGSEGIQDLMQSADDLGLVMSDEAVDAGAAFGDALADVKDSASALMTNIGAELMPVIMSVLDWVKEHLPEIQGFVQGLYTFLQGFVQGVVSFVSWLWQSIEPYIPVIVATIQDMVNGIMAFWNDNLKPMCEALMGFISEVLWPTIKAIIDLIAPYIEILVDSISDAIDGLMDVFKGLIKFITGVFTGDWEKAWEAVSDIFDGIAKGLMSIFKAPINWIIEGFNGFIRYLNTIEIPDWVPVVGGLGFHLNEIPLLAKGGTITNGGNAIVGEAGAEMITLPAGATVTPLNENNNAFVETNKKLDTLIDLLTKNSNAKMGVYIDGNALVGEIASNMDMALGRFASAAERGV